MAPSPRRVGCVVRALRAYLLFLAAVVTVSLVAGYVASAWRLAQADRGWAASFEAMDRFAARHPKRRTSAAALELDNLARPLGVRIMYRAEDYKPGASRDGPNDGILKAIGKFVSEQEKATTEVLQLASADARRFLDQNASVLDVIETHVLESGPIEWDEDIDDPTTHLPGLLGHRYLQNLFLARALEADRVGQDAAFEKSLEASWRLNQSLRQRADLISNLITIAVATMEHGVLRRAATGSSVWMERLAREDFRAEALTALQLEAYTFSLPARRFRGIFDLSEMEGAAPEPNGPGVFLGRFFTAPYLRLSLSGYSDHFRRTLEQVRGTDLCTLDVERLSDEFVASLPRWNIIGRLAGAQARVWASVAEVSLDAERTRLVLEARTAPVGAALGEPRSSGVCGQVRWVRENAGGGRVTIHLDRDPFPHSKAPRQWSFTVSRRARLRG